MSQILSPSINYVLRSAALVALAACLLVPAEPRPGPSGPDLFSTNGRALMSYSIVGRRIVESGVLPLSLPLPPSDSGGGWTVAVTAHELLLRPPKGRVLFAIPRGKDGFPLRGKASSVAAFRFAVDYARDRVFDWRYGSLHCYSFPNGGGRPTEAVFPVNWPPEVRKDISWIELTPNGRTLFVDVWWADGDISGEYFYELPLAPSGRPISMTHSMAIGKEGPVRISDGRYAILGSDNQATLQLFGADGPYQFYWPHPGYNNVLKPIKTVTLPGPKGSVALGPILSPDGNALTVGIWTTPRKLPPRDWPIWTQPPCDRYFLNLRQSKPKPILLGGPAMFCLPDWKKWRAFLIGPPANGRLKITAVTLPKPGRPPHVIASGIVPENMLFLADGQ